MFRSSLSGIAEHLFMKPNIIPIRTPNKVYLESLEHTALILEQERMRELEIMESELEPHPR